MERLRVSKNKRYLETISGKPVVWIADTTWTMPQRIKWDDALYLMDTRKSQGFTALQIVALDPERDVEMRNPAGDKALINHDLNQPNENYFRYLDWILDQAEERGLYVLLLPVWGQLVVGEDWSGNTYEKTVTEENAYSYGKWIGERYKDRTNILWCLGGDRQPIHKQKDDYRTVWRLMAEGLAKGITGQDLKYNKKNPLWQELMITYHACFEMETGECSTFSYWTDEEAWISFVMIQSGHGTTVKNYELIQKEYDRDTIMPVWDGEPGYEAMPTCWPIKDLNSFHGTEIVRKRAYWSLLAGAFGYTYGHASVWCSVAEREKNFIAFTDWYESIHSEGSAQIAYIHNFIKSMKGYACEPCQEVLVEQNANEDVLDYHVSAAFANEGKALCVYFPSGGEQTICVEKIASGANEVHGWWYNTRDGKFYTPEMKETDHTFIYGCEKGQIHVQAPEAELNHDWLLIITRNETREPIQKEEFGIVSNQEEIKKVFEW